MCGRGDLREIMSAWVGICALAKEGLASEDPKVMLNKLWYINEMAQKHWASTVQRYQVHQGDDNVRQQRYTL